MKKYNFFDYLQTFGVKSDFFNAAHRTHIGYHAGELVFKSQNSGLFTKLKKQFIPVSEVFPKNRKKIYLSLDTFEGGNYTSIYGIGSPQQVEKNYDKAINEISNKIHKKIQKQVSDGEDYDDAFYEESEEEFGLHQKYGKILEKYKIFEHDYGGSHKHRDLDFHENTPEERWEYEDKFTFLSNIFGDFREAYFIHPYNEKNKRRLGLSAYFYLRYKKYSFMFDFSLFNELHSENIEIKI